MRIEELRIGNWVRHTKRGEYVRIVSLDWNGYVGFVDSEAEVYSVGTSVLEPIPLTEELLEAVGAHRFCDYDFFEISEFLDVIIGKKRSISNSSSGGLMISCSYLHELQNLYYAITGEDLKVNRNTLLE